MRSIFVLLILVMIGLNGKGQSVTALPDSVLSQCCLEVTLLNGNVTTVDWVFIQYITRDGTGTKLFVEYAPNFGGIQWETQIRIQDDFDDVLERSKFIVIPFTVSTTDYGINRNWIANIEENTATGGTWIYGRFGTPTKRKFSAVEDYETMKNLLLACRPRAIVLAENGLYTEGDTVRMGGILIEDTRIETDTFDWEMIDTLSSASFGIDHNSPEFGDTTAYFARRWGAMRHTMAMGRDYWQSKMIDTTSGKYSRVLHSWFNGDPYFWIQNFNPSDITGPASWAQFNRDNISFTVDHTAINPYYTTSFLLNSQQASIGVSESGGGYPGNGVSMGAIGYGSGVEFLFLKTKNVDDVTASVGQFLQLQDVITGKVEFATIDLSGYLPIADTAAMLLKYPSTVGYGILKSGKTIRADTSKLATLFDISGFPSGTGTADRSARWSATNTLATGNITDNGTKLQALFPWQFQSYTTAGLPTGVTGYNVYNSTLADQIYYNTSDWYYTTPWKQSTSGSNVFLNSGSAIVNSSSVLNSLYKLQVNGGALYSGATFTTTATNQAALDIRGINLTAQSGSTHSLWGINIEGAMTFNTGNQTYGGLRIATTSNATASQFVKPFEVVISAGVIGSAQIQNTNASNGADWTVGGGGNTSPERVIMRSPNGGTSASSVPGFNYLSTGSTFGWAISGQNKGLVILSNITGINPNAVDPTFQLRGNKTLIGQRPATTPTATLEITGEGTGNSTTTFLVQNSGRANGAFRIMDDASARFGGKMMVGSDTSFVHDPANDSTYMKGNTRIQTGNLTIEKTSGTPYLNIVAKGTSGNQEANIYMKSRGSFSPGIEIDANTGAVSSAKHLYIYNYNTARGGQQVFRFGSEYGQFGGASVGRFVVRDSLDSSNQFIFNASGVGVFSSYGTGTKEASDLSKTESVYNAIFATDGTLLEKRANAEQYNAITSTTSPVTLSSTIADNLINQGSTQATFTLTFPASPADGQVLTITYNNAITALTLDGNGNTIVGSATTTAVAGSQRKFKYYSSASAWIKIY